MSYFDQAPQQMGSDEKAAARRLYHMSGVFLIIFGLLSSKDLGELLIYTTMNFKIVFGSWGSALGMLFDISIFYLMLALVLNAGLLTFDRTRGLILPPMFIVNWLLEKHRNIRTAIEWDGDTEGSHENK